MDETELKKTRREYSFNMQWLSDPSYSGWLAKVSFDTARCTVCNVSFIVKYDGIKAITTHRNSEKHKGLILAGTTSHSMSRFFTEELQYRGKFSDSS